MNPEYPTSAPTPQQVRNPLNSMQPGEQIVCEIKRHPIGMFGIYAGVGLLIIIAAVVGLVLAPNMSSDNADQVRAVGAVAFLIFALITVGFVFISHIVYWGNRWIVTSDSVTQVLQRALFDKQSSQLSLGNLEDITVNQDGILAHMFNFGVLRAETAGERSKFVFIFCPNPNFYAQQILNARERFEQGHHGGRVAPAQPSQADMTALGQQALNGYDDTPDPGININTQN